MGDQGRVEVGTHMDRSRYKEENRLAAFSLGAKSPTPSSRTAGGEVLGLEVWADDWLYGSDPCGRKTDYWSR